MKGLGGLLVAGLMLGCVAKAEERITPPMRELLVTAKEFSFTSQDTIESGYIRVRMESAGKELHHLQLIKLENGLTAEQVLEQARREVLVFPDLKFVGGPSVPGPSGASEVVLDLEPGKYLMVCYMTHGKVRHLLMGMTRKLTVIPAREPGATPPQEDERMALHSYGFGMDSVIKPGGHVFRVENQAEEPHEVDIVRIPDGSSVEQAMAWLKQPGGPPPFEPSGGTMILSKGKVAYAGLTMRTGQYMLLCFVPDTRDGRPHIAHGMVRVISVREDNAVDWNAARQERGRR